jgi:methyl-accepting chemotaxis protein
MKAQSSNTASPDQDISGRLAFIGIDEKSSKDLLKLKPIIERELPGGLDRFYDIVRSVPEARKRFSSDQHMSKAKNAQLGHWGSIASGRFDEDYVNRVRTIGSVHARIGLEPRWYIGGYGLLVEHMVRGLMKDYWPAGGMFAKNKTSADEASDLVVSLGSRLVQTQNAMSVASATADRKLRASLS